jgi:hypothetical protein
VGARGHSRPKVALTHSTTRALRLLRVHTQRALGGRSRRLYRLTPLRPRGCLAINQIQLDTCCPLDNAPAHREGSPLEVSAPSPAARGPRMHRGHTHTHTHTHTHRQAGGQAGRRAGAQAGRKTVGIKKRPPPHPTMLPTDITSQTEGGKDGAKVGLRPAQRPRHSQPGS